MKSTIVSSGIEEATRQEIRVSFWRRRRPGAELLVGASAV